MNCRIAILAAGESSRLGSPKQLLDWRGKPLLRHLALQALGTGCATCIVLGAHHARIRPVIADLPLQIIDNPEWQEGMASSVRVAVPADDTDALLLMVCDQPLVSTATLQALIDAYQQHRSRITASAYDGTLGVPALFDRQLFDELRHLHGPQGAKVLLQRHREQVCPIPFAAGGLDLDTQADVARLKAGSGDAAIDPFGDSL